MTVEWSLLISEAIRFKFIEGNFYLLGIMGTLIQVYFRMMSGRRKSLQNTNRPELISFWTWHARDSSQSFLMAAAPTIVSSGEGWSWVMQQRPDANDPEHVSESNTERRKKRSFWSSWVLTQSQSRSRETSCSRRRIVPELCGDLLCCHRKHFFSDVSSQRMFDQLLNLRVGWLLKEGCWTQFLKHTRQKGARFEG